MLSSVWLWLCRLQAADAHYISRWTTGWILDDVGFPGCFICVADDG